MGCFTIQEYGTTGRHAHAGEDCSFMVRPSGSEGWAQYAEGVYDTYGALLRTNGSRTLDVFELTMALADRANLFRLEKDEPRTGLREEYRSKFFADYEGNMQRMGEFVRVEGLSDKPNCDGRCQSIGL